MTFNGQTVAVAAWLRFAAQIVVMLLVAAGIYFKLDNRVSNVEHLAATTLDSQNIMDKSGTHRSHETDTVQQAEIDANTRRIEALEKAVGDLAPKVDRIDTNVLWLMAKQNKDGR